MNRITRIIFTILLIFVPFLLLCPQQSHAATSAIDYCIPKKDSGEYTQAVVRCIKAPIRTTAVTMLKKLSDYFRPVVVVIDTLAIVFFGISIMGLSGNLAPPSFNFILRFGIISFFGYNLGGFAEKIIGTETHAGILDQLLELVTGKGYSPWVEIDKFIGKLLGFAKDPNHSQLKDGILGLLGGSWSFKVIGGMLTVMGIRALWTVLGFIFEAVFLYISSFMVIGFLIILSPLIIPFAAFNYSGEYAKKWLNLLISSILAPVIAFAILWIFVGSSTTAANGTVTNTGLFTTIVDDVFKVLDNHHIDKSHYLENYTHNNTALCSWVQTADPDKIEELANLHCEGHKAGDTECKPKESIPANNPSMGASVATHDNCEIKIPVLDFGKDDTKIKKELFFALLNLWIFASIMKNMMQNVQTIASGIAGTPNYTGAAAAGGSPLAGRFSQQIG